MLRIFASIGAIQIVTILSGLIRTKYIAVTLGPEGTGIIGIIDQVVQLTSFISALSLPLASMKFLSRANSESAEAFKKAYSAFLDLLLLISLTASLCLFLLVSSDIQLPIGEIGRYRHYLYIALLGMPAMMLGGFLSNALAAAERPNSAALLSLIYSLSLTVAVLIGIVIADITGYYWATVISGAVITASAILYLRDKFGLSFLLRGFHPLAMLRQQPEILHFSALLFFASVAHSFSLFATRYFVLDNHGEAAAGLLHALLALAISIGMVLTPINGFFLMPKVNRNIDNQEKLRFAMDFQKIQIIFMTVIVLPFVIYPSLTIHILFSKEFAVVAPFLFLFVLGQFLGQLGGVYQSLMIGLDSTRMFSAISCTSSLLFVVLSWLMVPHWEFWGIGIAFLISRLFLLVSSLGFLGVNHPIRIPARTIAVAIYSTSIIAVIGYYASRYNDLDLGVFVAKTTIYILSVSILYLFLDHSEKMSLSRQLRSLTLLKSQKGGPE